MRNEAEFNILARTYKDDIFRLARARNKLRSILKEEVVK